MREEEQFYYEIPVSADAEGTVRVPAMVIPTWDGSRPALTVDWDRVSDDSVLSADVVLNDVLDADMVG